MVNYQYEQSGQESQRVGKAPLCKSIKIDHHEEAGILLKIAHKTVPGKSRWAKPTDVVLPLKLWETSVQ
jgi:hypothetical protein